MKDRAVNPQKFVYDGLDLYEVAEHLEWWSVGYLKGRDMADEIPPHALHKSLKAWLIYGAETVDFQEGFRAGYVEQARLLGFDQVSEQSVKEGFDHQQRRDCANMFSKETR